MRRGVGALVLASGSLVALVGTALPWSILRAPWIPAGELRRTGIVDDGLFAAFAAVLCLLLVLPAWRWRGVAAVTALLAAYVVGLSVYRWRDIGGRVGRSGADVIPVQVADGVWVTLAGGVVMAAGALVLLANRRGQP